MVVQQKRFFLVYVTWNEKSMNEKKSMNETSGGSLMTNSGKF